MHHFVIAVVMQYRPLVANIRGRRPGNGERQIGRFRQVIGRIVLGRRRIDTAAATAQQHTERASSHQLPATFDQRIAVQHENPPLVVIMFGGL